MLKGYDKGDYYGTEDVDRARKIVEGLQYGGDPVKLNAEWRKLQPVVELSKYVKENGLVDQYMRAVRDSKQTTGPKAIRIAGEKVIQYDQRTTGADIRKQFVDAMASNPRFKDIPREQIERLFPEYEQTDVKFHVASKQKPTKQDVQANTRAVEDTVLDKGGPGGLYSAEDLRDQNITGTKQVPVLRMYKGDGSEFGELTVNLSSDEQRRMYPKYVMVDRAGRQWLVGQDADAVNKRTYTEGESRMQGTASGKSGKIAKSESTAKEAPLIYAPVSQNAAVLDNMSNGRVDWRGWLQQRSGAPQQEPTKQAEPPVVSSDEQYNALPSGTTFRAPDGKTYKKP